MKHPFFAVPATLFLASGVVAGTSPVFGSWDCSAMEFTLDEANYKVSGEVFGVAEIVESKSRSYLVTLDDDYQFGLMHVRPNALTWYSPWSDDVFDCKRR